MVTQKTPRLSLQSLSEHRHGVIATADSFDRLAGLLLARPREYPREIELICEQYLSLIREAIDKGNVSLGIRLLKRFEQTMVKVLEEGSEESINLAINELSRQYPSIQSQLLIKNNSRLSDIDYRSAREEYFERMASDETRCLKQWHGTLMRVTTAWLRSDTTTEHENGSSTEIIECWKSCCLKADTFFVSDYPYLMTESLIELCMISEGDIYEGFLDSLSKIKYNSNTEIVDTSFENILVFIEAEQQTEEYSSLTDIPSKFRQLDKEPTYTYEELQENLNSIGASVTQKIDRLAWEESSISELKRQILSNPNAVLSDQQDLVGGDELYEVGTNNLILHTPDEELIYIHLANNVAVEDVSYFVDVKDRVESVVIDRYESVSDKDNIDFIIISPEISPKTQRELTTKGIRCLEYTVEAFERSSDVRKYRETTISDFVVPNPEVTRSSVLEQGK